MKRLVLLLIALASRALMSQISNYAYHDGFTATFGMVTLNGKTYHIEKSRVLNYPCTDRIEVVCMKECKEIFRKEVGSGAFYNEAHIGLASDGSILTTCGTSQVGCDYGGVEYILTKVDTLGNMVLQSKENFRMKEPLELPNGLIYVATENDVAVYDQAGQFKGPLSKIIKWPFSLVHSIARYNKTRLLVNLGNPAYLFAVDSIGEVSVPGVISHSLQSMVQHTDGGMLGINGDNVYRYSNDFTSVTSSSNSITGFRIKAFDQRHDSIFITGQDLSDKLFYGVLNGNFAPVHLAFSNLNNTTGTGLRLVNDKVEVICTVGNTTGQYENHTWSDMMGQHSTSGYFLTELSGLIGAKQDVGVVNAFVTGNQLSTIYRYQGGGYYVYNMTADVTVKNYGVDTVTSFIINHFSRDFFPTGYLFNGLNQEFKVSVPPGGTVTVSTYSFYSTHYFNDPVHESVDFNVCFRTSVPSRMNDYFSDNDQFCRNTQFLTTPIGEEDHIPAIKIFPIPAKNGFSVFSSLPLRRIELYNPAGKLLVSESAADFSYDFDRRDLPAGLYILRCQSGDHTAYAKVIFE